MLIAMCLVFLAIFIGGIILGHSYSRKHKDDVSFSACLIGTIGGLGLLISFAVLIGVAVSVTNLSVIDERIAMYEEENARIEQQIAEVVTQYQKHEADIFENVSPESSITLISLYPELKSDTLVQEQITVYIENNRSIKELRNQKIGGGPLKWWLYFGG